MAQSKNIGRKLAQLGEIPVGHPMDMDDQDVVEEYGLDPKLIGTEEINDAALVAARNRKVRNLVEGGWDEANAIKMADKELMETRQSHKKIHDRWLKKVGKE